MATCICTCVNSGKGGLRGGGNLTYTVEALIRGYPQDANRVSITGAGHFQESFL